MNPTRQILLGALFLTAFGILAVYTLYLYDLPWLGDRTSWRIEFPAANGLRVGDGVRASGMRIGRVTKMTFDPVDTFEAEIIHFADCIERGTQPVQSYVDGVRVLQVIRKCYDFVEADKIINVPIAKTHSLSRLTMGMKNWLGALGGNRNQLHQKLDQAMIDLAAFFKPCLTVMDGYRILIRNGPQGGRLSDVELFKTVVAGVDYVAVDAAGATFFDIPPQDLPYLQIAHQMGIGEINLEKLKIEKRTV